jgi:hypothetical protein
MIPMKDSESPTAGDIQLHSGLSGERIEMRLEEHPYHKKFLTTIIGPASFDDPYFEGTYLLKIEPLAARKLSVEYVMFHPEFYDLHKSFLKRRDVIRESKELGRPSLNIFLMKSSLAHDRLHGRVYTTHRQDLIEARIVNKNEFSVLAYGIITRPVEQPQTRPKEES